MQCCPTLGFTGDHLGFELLEAGKRGENANLNRLQLLGMLTRKNIGSSELVMDLPVMIPVVMAILNCSVFIIAMVVFTCMRLCVMFICSAMFAM